MIRISLRIYFFSCLCLSFLKRKKWAQKVTNRILLVALWASSNYFANISFYGGAYISLMPNFTSKSLYFYFSK